MFVQVLFHSRSEIALKLILVQKENEILRRKLELKNKRPVFYSIDRFIVAMLFKLSEKVKYVLSLARPETVLRWYHKLIKKRWTFIFESNKPGRPGIPASVKQLILRMKNENIYMRSGKIRGELLKIGIDMSVSTIRRVLREFRKHGEFKSCITWKQYVNTNNHKSALSRFIRVTPWSICSARFYVFFLMYIITREIVRFDVTDIPSKIFVRNQLLTFIGDREGEKKYLIHDNSGEFAHQDYDSLGIISVPTSPESPDMNAHAERFVGSIRREALDSFIIVNYGQLYSIVKEYIEYYNTVRPHQGIGQSVPCGYTPLSSGIVVSKPFLSGLWHHYFREAA
jgi:transposase InsO family protein